MMEISHKEHHKKGSFYIIEGGQTVAEIQYLRSGESEITIYHTEVDEKLRGEGIGQDLVAAAVEFARKNHLKVNATCPYARKVIDRTPEFRDVLINA